MIHFPEIYMLIMQIGCQGALIGSTCLTQIYQTDLKRKTCYSIPLPQLAPEGLAVHAVLEDPVKREMKCFN